MGCTNGKKQDGTVGEADAGSKAPATSGSVGSTGKLLDKYTLGKVLGQGAFGIVYSCKKKGTKDEFAVKMIDKVETPLADIMQEAAMLQKLEHPCIVKLHAVYHEKAFVCMVMDIYKGGDMIEGMQLHWKQAGMLPISVVGNVSKQMMESIAFLHATSVVHRDVKGDNYLMDRKDIQNPACRIFLSDFGTVRELKEGERLNSKCGTKTYWAPEFFSLDYSLKVDVWAVGIAIFGLGTGRFPFKGEEEVKSKKLMFPTRFAKPCAELLKKVLERKESARPSAGQALNHPFVRSLRASEKEAVERMDFKPEVKESGANAGIAERRRELIGRLEDAQEPSSGKQVTVSLKELKNGSSFDVVDRQLEKTTRFAWWTDAVAREENLIDFTGARSALEDDPKNSAESSANDLKQTLEDHNISTDEFGKGQAKKFEEFVVEVQSGSSRLMLDATKHKSIVRVVDVVLLRITFNAEDVTKYLIMVKEQFPDGRERADINQLPGTKKEPHENGNQATLRIVQDLLHFSDCKIKFDFTQCECFEDDENSPSYPGVRTVYRKEIYQGRITTSDPRVLQRIGVVGDGHYTSTDSKGYNKTFRWLDEQECEDRKVQLQSNRKKSETSALVHAPIGIGEEDLKIFLDSNGVDASQFGEGTNKSLKEFSEELVKGEAALARQPDGKVIRVVDVVILKITRGTDVLVEVEEEVKGTKKSLNRLPAVKRRPDENMFLAAHRAIAKNLKMNDNFIILNPLNVLIAEEEKQSAAYCGLPTLYRKRIVAAELMKEESSCTLASL
mmetsp:Transcript_21315/g.60353  ORF Transcript_21315/g.60353 Transcript_21315/m.60353 type:complete len:784 (+) Transcript_21315:135-2486(+)